MPIASPPSATLCRIWSLERFISYSFSITSLKHPYSRISWERHPRSVPLSNRLDASLDDGVHVVNGSGGRRTNVKKLKQKTSARSPPVEPSPQTQRNPPPHRAPRPHPPAGPPPGPVRP